VEKRRTNDQDLSKNEQAAERKTQEGSLPDMETTREGDP